MSTLEHSGLDNYLDFDNSIDAFNDTTVGMRFLYESMFGRCFLKLMTAPAVSRLAGRFLNSRMSRCMIDRFIRKNDIDMNEYIAKSCDAKSFNDFFCREIRPEARPLPSVKSRGYAESAESAESARRASCIDAHLISPCDGLLSAYKIEDTAFQIFNIKRSRYTLETLLNDSELAKQFAGGTCLILRLMATNYHHYCYIDDGTQEQPVRINGRLHTVNPISNEHVMTFTENSREFTLMHTDHFGDVVQMEVGAMLVGKIVNDYGSSPVRCFKQGDEKGHFEFGGSTIILLFQEGKLQIDNRVFELTANNREIPVKLGTILA